MIAVTYGLFVPQLRETFDLTPSLLGVIGSGSYLGYCLEELVPKDNFYYHLEERLDLSFIGELVENLYAASGCRKTMLARKTGSLLPLSALR